MTEYELTQLAAATMGNFLATLGVFLSVVTAFIVATYIAARKLTALQLAIVNGCFLIAATILGYLVVANFMVFYNFASLNEDRSFARAAEGPVLVDFTWPLTILLMGIVIGSLVFMYSVRNQAAVERVPSPSE